MQKEWRILFTHVEVWHARAPNFNTGTMHQQCSQMRFLRVPSGTVMIKLSQDRLCKRLCEKGEEMIPLKNYPKQLAKLSYNTVFL